MDKKPLVSEQITEGEHLIREFDRYKPVRAAFWLTEADSKEWYLYLASDQINDQNFDLAYGEVLRILRTGQSLWLDPFQVKVVGTDSTVAKAALEVMKNTSTLPTWYHGRRFGNLSVDEVLIYPEFHPVSA